MKKKLVLIVLFVIILVVILGHTLFNGNNSNLEKLLNNVEDDVFSLENYSVFGTHLNINGCADKVIEGDLSLVLKNLDEEIDIKATFNEENEKTCFYISKNNNDGLLLDDLNIGDYILLVKNTINSEEIKYYSLKNNSSYDGFEYYTITKNNKNNKISMTFNKFENKNSNIDYVKFNIKQEKLPNDVYDITLDAGHGGNDPGANTTFNGKTYYEANYTLDITLALKEILEDAGLKVKLTRDSDVNLKYYGDGGRAVIPNEVSSKYSLSIHLNSSEGEMNYGGVEVYTPNDIDYTFATMMANSIANIVDYSKKPTGKVKNGVYYTYFNSYSIEESRKETISNGLKPYDIKVGAPEMYMIREVGGLLTKAYIDGRNDVYGLNKYYNSNQTAEPYLLEVAYINYSKDLKKLIDSREQFAEAIGAAITDYLNLS